MEWIKIDKKILLEGEVLSITFNVNKYAYYKEKLLNYINFSKYENPDEQYEYKTIYIRKFYIVTIEFVGLANDDNSDVYEVTLINGNKFLAVIKGNDDI